MSQIYIESGVRYDAKIVHVPFFAGHDTIQGKLVDAGFKDVEVWKDDDGWHAAGTWTGESGNVELDDHIDVTSVRRIS